MSVTSVEALEALPVGTQVTIRPASDREAGEWVRGETGWAPRGRGNVALPSHMFQAHIAQGWVSQGPLVVPAQVGQWREGRTYWYYILAVDPNSQVAAVLRFRRAGNAAPTLNTSSRMTEWPVLATPPAVPAERFTQALAMLWLRSEEERSRGERQQQQLKNRVDPAPLQPALTQIRNAVAAFERALNPPDPF